MTSKISKSKATKKQTKGESSSVKSMNRYDTVGGMAMNSGTGTSETNKSKRRTSEIDILCELVVRYMNNKSKNVRGKSSSIKIHTKNSSDAETMKSCTNMISMAIRSNASTGKQIRLS